MNDDFYIGYLPKAPGATARFVRKATALLATGALVVAAGLAVSLPYIGDGVFEFGNTRQFDGTVRCDAMHLPRLVTADEDYLLVGVGKNGVPPEICGAEGTEVSLRGTLIRREGRQLIEIASLSKARGVAASEPADVPLGNFTLTGEIVDSKCFFGVMNPGEGRAHRACAILCLRGRVPPVFVARDRTGATVHLLIAAETGTELLPALLPWVGESVQASGQVVRRGRWLVWTIDAARIKRAQ